MTEQEEILIVDDTPIIQSLLTDVLVSGGSHNAHLVCENQKMRDKDKTKAQLIKK